MQAVRWLLVVFGCIFLWTTEQTRAEEPYADIPEVVVKQDGRYQERSYTIRNDQCEITWTLFLNELNRGVIKHRSRCGLSLEKQSELLDRLIEKVLRDPAVDWPLKTLFWGRLSPDFQPDTEMARRLSLTAFRNSAWDNNRGRPVKGHANDCVLKLAAQKTIYPELQQVFQKHGLLLNISGAEKVLVAKASTLVYFPWLETKGVSPTDKLPYDFLLWFSLENQKPLPGDSGQ